MNEINIVFIENGTDKVLLDFFDIGYPTYKTGDIVFLQDLHSATFLDGYNFKIKDTNFRVSQGVDEYNGRIVNTTITYYVEELNND